VEAEKAECALLSVHGSAQLVTSFLSPQHPRPEMAMSQKDGLHLADYLQVQQSKPKPAIQPGKSTLFVLKDDLSGLMPGIVLIRSLLHWNTPAP
jgi:hypothetical protein